MARLSLALRPSSKNVKSSNRRITANRKKREVVSVSSGVPAIKDKLTRSEFVEALRVGAEEKMDREYTKKEAMAFLNAYEELMIGSIKKGGYGEFVHSGFFKIKLKEVPRKIRKAIKKGELVRNPRTGEETPHPTGREKQIIPATVKPKLLPQKKLKLAALNQ